MTRVVCYGLGPIGLQIARIISKRGDMQIVGAVDIDPRKIGMKLSTLIQETESDDVVVTCDTRSVLNRNCADIVVLATGSSLKTIAGQIYEIVSARLPVISTCEELAFPTANNRQLLTELDEHARQHGVAIYGTGVNPGFAMDALPLMLTAPCEDVTSVRVTRMQDAGIRRIQFQTKIGAGITREEFDGRVASGALRHVGFLESTSMIAESIGWNLTDYKETIEPVIAVRDVTAPGIAVAAGRVAGVKQVARAFVNGYERIVLELIAYVGAPDSYDTVTIEGVPKVVSTVKGGIHGDIATAAVTVNSIPRVIEASGGVLTATEIGIPYFRAPSRRATR